MWPAGTFATMAMAASSATSKIDRPSFGAALRAAGTSVPLNEPALGFPMGLRPNRMIAGWASGFAGLLIGFAPMQKARCPDGGPWRLRVLRWVDRSSAKARLAKPKARQFDQQY